MISKIRSNSLCLSRSLDDHLYIKKDTDSRLLIAPASRFSAANCYYFSPALAIILQRGQWQDAYPLNAILDIGLLGIIVLMMGKVGVELRDGASEPWHKGSVAIG